MSSLNKVILIGHVGADPEVRYLPNGTAAVNLSIATSERWKDKASGEKREATEWHRCVFFDKLAEIVGEYVRKGSLLCVEGVLKTRKWQDKDGQDRYTTEIHVRQMNMLGPRRDDGERSGEPAQQRQAEPQRAPASLDDMDDDIPF